jgi:hypothetical protein
MTRAGIKPFEPVPPNCISRLREHSVCYICFPKGAKRHLFFKECVSIVLSNTTFNNISAMLWWSGQVLGGAESNAVKHAVCCSVSVF